MKHLRSVLVYGLFVSIPATVADWGIFYVGVKMLDWNYVLVATLGWLMGNGINAFLSQKVAFESKGRSGKSETLLMYVGGVISYLLHLGILSGCVELLALDEMVSKIIATVVTFFFNYGYRQFFVFSAKPKW
jgi:putative flippase GtrA